LERLVSNGIDNIIRVGGQSNSAILARKNLRVLSRAEAKTTNERNCIRNLLSDSEDTKETITVKLRLLHDVARLEWQGIRMHLQRHHPRIYTQLQQFGNGDFDLDGSRDAFSDWIRKIPYEVIKKPREEMETLLRKANENIYQILPYDRRRLVYYWVNEIFVQIGRELSELLEANNERMQDLSNVYGEVDRRCLQNADVIGVTTAGFAHRISVLRHVKSKVTICEEAGEILEAHLLSALLPSLEHLIQIGDHTQLRPPINDHRLSLESPHGTPYQLDRSMFERLSASKHGRVPLSQLNVQRRMRPEIAKLLRGTTYPGLIDHESVKTLPDVVGMRRNLFWLHHTEHEDRLQGNYTGRKSYSNLWEVEMIQVLVRHIVRQGVHGSGDIAILTPYAEQLQNIKRTLGQNFNILTEKYQRLLGPSISEVQKSSTNSGICVPVPDHKHLSQPIRISTV
jgi:hypothetical protein